MSIDRDGLPNLGHIDVGSSSAQSSSIRLYLADADDFAVMNTVRGLSHLNHDKFGVAFEVIDPDAPFACCELDSLTGAEPMFEIDDAFDVTVPDEAATTGTASASQTWRDTSLASRETPTFGANHRMSHRVPVTASLAERLAP